MADLQIEGNWLVTPNAEIERKWIEVQIQERKSRINRHKQDMEDLIKGKLVDLEARILMLEQELKELEAKKNAVTINGGK
jgi:NAD-specific glutamate dehydrogenase